VVLAVKAFCCLLNLAIWDLDGLGSVGRGVGGTIGLKSPLGSKMNVIATVRRSKETPRSSRRTGAAMTNTVKARTRTAGMALKYMTTE